MPIDMDALLEASLPSIIEGMKTKITTQISWELETKAAVTVGVGHRVPSSLTNGLNFSALGELSSVI